MYRARHRTLKDFRDITRSVEWVYSFAENEIIKDIIDRLRIRGETSVPEWMAKSLAQVEQVKGFSRDLFEMADIQMEKQLGPALKEIGYYVVQETDRFIIQAGRDAIPITPIQTILDAIGNETKGNIRNHVNAVILEESEFYLGDRAGITVLYRDLINQSYVLHTTGHYTLEESVKKTLKDWARNGLDSGFVDKGGYRWKMDNYVRMVMRTMHANTYNRIRIARMEDYGMSTVLMSSKPSARPACAPIQGKVLDISEDRRNPQYPNVMDYGFGEPWGTRGINCGHQWFPFDPDVNENNQTQYDPKEAEELEAMNQGRNRMLNSLRNTRERMEVAKALGDEDEYNQLKSLFSRQRVNLKNYDEQVAPHRAELSRKAWESFRSIGTETIFPGIGFEEIGGIADVITTPKSVVDKTKEFDEYRPDSSYRLSDENAKRKWNMNIHDPEETISPSKFYPQKEYDIIRARVDAATKRYPEWGNIYTRLEDYSSINETKGGGYYDSYEKEIYVNSLEDARESRWGKYQHQTFFHEFGHFVDSKLGDELLDFDFLTDYYSVKPMKGETLTFREALELDTNNLLDDFTREHYGERSRFEGWRDYWDEYGAGSPMGFNVHFTGYLFDKSASLKDGGGGHINIAIGDIINGATGGDVLRGHSRDYWERPEALGKEAFAHFFASNAYGGESMTDLQKFFPTAYGMWEKMMEYGNGLVDLYMEG